MYNTAMTLGGLRGAVIGCILAAGSWPLAHFYNEPRLIPLVSTLAFAPILRGLISPVLVHYARQMDFRRQAILDVVSKVLSGVTAVTVALLTHSYWSIAIGTILTPAALVVGSYILAPLRPRLTLKEWPIFADIVGWNILSQILMAINWQIGRITLPRFVETASFGRYAMASDLSAIPIQTLVAPIVFPLNVAFVTAQQKGDLKSTYLKATGAIFILMLPIYCFMAIASRPLIDLFLGSKWDGVAILLSGLAFASIIEIPCQPMLPLASSLNQSRRITLRALVQCLTIIPLTIAGVALYGVAGAVVATCSVMFIALIMTMITVKSLIDASYREQIGALVGPLLAVLGSGIILFFATRFIDTGSGTILLFLEIGVVGLIYVAFYICFIYLVSLRLPQTAGAEQMIVSIALDTLAKFKRSVRNGE
jgi:O-antigen/teichoic acid export membrane protein